MMALHAPLRDLLRGRVLGQQAIQDALLGFFPSLIDLDEDVELVGVPTIKSLWREAGAAGDAIRVGVAIALLHELGRGSLQQDGRGVGPISCGVFGRAA